MNKNIAPLCMTCDLFSYTVEFKMENMNHGYTPNIRT